MKGKLLKKIKRTLCYVLTLGMIGGSLLPMKAEAATSAKLIAHYDFENVDEAMIRQIYKEVSI